MNLSDISTKIDKFTLHFMRDFVRGRVEFESYDEIACGKSLFSENRYKGISYIWWQFCIDHGEISREIIHDPEDDHFLIEEPDYFFDALTDTRDPLSHMLETAIPIYCPVLTRVITDCGTDYFGEGWDEIEVICLYKQEDYGMHCIPMQVFDYNQPNLTKRIIMR